MDENKLYFIHNKLEQQEKIIVQLVQIVAKTNKKLTDLQHKIAALEKVKLH